VAQLLCADARSRGPAARERGAIRRVREPEVAVHHFRICRLLRSEEGRELSDALVGHLRDADVRLGLGASEGTGRGVTAGEEIEERRLAGVRETRDRGDEIQSCVSLTSTSSPKIVRATCLKRCVGPVAYTSCRGTVGDARR